MGFSRAHRSRTRKPPTQVALRSPNTLTLPLTRAARRKPFSRAFLNFPTAPSYGLSGNSDASEPGRHQGG
jgi:hypothetical protein